MSKECKLYIGCVSKNTVEATIEYANSYKKGMLGLIPSRRQVDVDGGYIGMTTHMLYNFIKNRTYNVLLERDHGGPDQGKVSDTGWESLKNDSIYCDIIHIDPWKRATTFEEGLHETKQLISACNDVNFKGTYEISTESSIFEISPEELSILLEECGPEQISHAVVQSGTSLNQIYNTGVYDSDKLQHYLYKINEISKKYNTTILSKEHNGDYLDTRLIHDKFRSGLDSINIAPEFGVIETNAYLEEISKYKSSTLYDNFFDICYQSDTWKKWILPHTTLKDANCDKTRLIRICGHYQFETPEFKENIKWKLPDISKRIKRNMKRRIVDILHYD